MSQLTSFPQFTKLPTELRCKIWKLTLLRRLVELLEAADHSCYCSVCPLPNALRVCRDSRAAVINLYPYCFSTRFKEPRIRFNFSLDTIYINYGVTVIHFLDILTDNEVSRLRYLAVDEIAGLDAQHCDDDTHQELWGALERSMKHFTSLQEFTVVLIHHVSVWDDQQQDITFMMELHKRMPSVAKALPGYRREAKEFGRVSDWKLPKAEVLLMWG